METKLIIPKIKLAIEQRPKDISAYRDLLDVLYYAKQEGADILHDNQGMRSSIGTQMRNTVGSEMGEWNRLNKKRLLLVARDDFDLHLKWITAEITAE